MKTELDTLRDGLDTARDEAERHGREVERLTNERREALLSGDDAALGEIEAALTTAGRERERALLRADDLDRRVALAGQAAKAEARAADRRELEALCRERLVLAERIDTLVAELATAVAAWGGLGYRLHAAWLTKDFESELGPIRPSFVDDDRAFLCGAVPPALALALGGRPGGGHPLVGQDPAATALAKLESGPGPRLVAQPQPAGGATVTHLDDRGGT